MIFPDWNTATTKTAALPMAREWQWHDGGEADE